MSASHLLGLQGPQQTPVVKIPIPQFTYFRENTVVKCDQCQFRCLRTSDLAKHKRKKHSSPLTKNSDFNCDICEYSAKTQRNLDQHKTLHVLPENVELFECSKCDYKTLKASYMNRHLVKHKKSGNNGTRTVKISKTASTSFIILSQNRSF